MVFFRDIAGLLKKHIPETYAYGNILQCDEYGELPVVKAHGEGGRTPLETRIGDCFYNQFVR